MPPGSAPRLTEARRAEVTALIEAGPLAAGYQSGVRTGPMIGDLSEQRVVVQCHRIWPCRGAVWRSAACAPDCSPRPGMALLFGIRLATIAE
jgi:hypothetical protein